MKINKQPLSETSYNFGKLSYTDKNMVPVDILSLAFAYSQEKITKLVGKKQDFRIRVFKDLQTLTGLEYNYINKRVEKSKKPALLVHLLKNKLVTKDEYIELYKSLVEKTKQVGKYVSNGSGTNRMGGASAAAIKAAQHDGRGEFGENLTEDANKDLMNGGLKTWWKFKPEEVMRFVYWLKRQTPPTGSKFNTEWESVKKQLQTKFPHNESVNEATEESQVITDLRWIVKHSQNKPVKDPITKKKPRVDLFTASTIVQVYDAINDKNKQQFISKSIPQMASIAFKVMKK